MAFDEVWAEVQSLPDTAKLQMPGTLRDDTKKRLARKTPEEISEIVLQAVAEVDHGSIEPLDTLIRKRL